jgi:hypothetical protein
LLIQVLPPLFEAKRLVIQKKAATLVKPDILFDCPINIFIIYPILHQFIILPVNSKKVIKIGKLTVVSL